MFLSTIGVIHFASSIISLITGTVVLYKSKGTTPHKQIGYIYTISMFIVLATSFMLYRLHGTFGVLHWFAVISSITLLLGIVPMFIKPKEYLKLHYGFMYWSVIGLYCAFFAEVLTRIPFILKVDTNIIPIFYSLVGVATALVSAIGSIYFRKYKEKWNALIDDSKNNLEI
ncbi:hypothetical protein D1818_05670 [Aquimarina sp. BL5]|uniref:DUF2306 domain-containing protein n=1 Tax=Aquimarina sp. BL5 TaxID=1714860 RepID=UPI000E52CB20|nr:hypothetical protein D1818_05670 [Aquimarina sp. BL5]RKN04584.1 hypothetical protein D7036_12080 [Aquimarina sp. BL5]